MNNISNQSIFAARINMPATLKDTIDLKRLPQHIAIIMDGNGRWAKQRGKLRIFGHENGVQSVRDVCEACAELGISYLTLFAFSTENWKRPRVEIDALIALLVQTLRAEIKTLNDNNIRLRAIGDTASLGKQICKELDHAIKATSHNKGLNLVLALSYSSRWELTEAVKSISEKSKNGTLKTEDINPELVSRHLSTAEFPDPELLIRTSGEYRLSNFLLWQSAYTELYFTPVLWPDFRKEHLFRAIIDYQRRERRFGKISEQFIEV